MPLPKEQLYTVEDIYKLPDGQRAELIDGVIYNMAPRGTLHQVITGELYATIRDFIKKIMVNASLTSPRLLFFSAIKAMTIWSLIYLSFARLIK